MGLGREVLDVPRSTSEWGPGYWTDWGGGIGVGPPPIDAAYLSEQNARNMANERAWLHNQGQIIALPSGATAMTAAPANVSAALGAATEQTDGTDTSPLITIGLAVVGFFVLRELFGG